MDEAVPPFRFPFNNERVLTRLYKLHKFNFNAGELAISATTQPNKTDLPRLIRICPYNVCMVNVLLFPSIIQHLYHHKWFVSKQNL